MTLPAAKRDRPSVWAHKITFIPTLLDHIFNSITLKSVFTTQTINLFESEKTKYVPHTEAEIYTIL